MSDRIPVSLGMPIIGLGGSAGASPALKAFFDNAKPVGAAYLIVSRFSAQDVDQDIREALQVIAPFKLIQVAGPTELVADHVYLIPQGSLPVLGVDIVDLAPADGPLARNFLDLFFRDLARAYGQNAIAVVLSGSEADGAIGLERVKSEGGFTLAQEPGDAAFPEMPASAVTAGHVDAVLPAGELPEKISSIICGRSPERVQGTQEHGEEQGDGKPLHLREILTLVRVRTGHDFTNYKRPTILRRIGRRLQLHGLPDMAAYLRLLREKPEEVQRLLKDLLITVTNFFRDPESFLYLEHHVLPGLFAGKTSKDCVRVWSCGCGSGEEPYSLGMLLMEQRDLMPDPPRVQIFASDINQDAVKVARDGCYKAVITTDIAPERIKRFFTEKADGSLQVSKELRDAVLFAPHNILHDPPFSHLDLVVCRNLLIYLNRQTQSRVMEVFSFALKPDGFLFLGSSEGAETGETLFSTVDKKNKVYQNSQPVKKPLLNLGQATVRWDAKAPETIAGVPAGGALEYHHHRLISRYAPPSLLINREHEIVHMTGKVGDFMQMPSGLPTRDLVKSVHPSLQLDLRAVLMTASQEKREVEVSDVRFTGYPEKLVSILAWPTEIGGSAYFLVVFDAHDFPRERINTSVLESISAESAVEAVVRRLEEELQETRERLHLVMEQSEVTTEELKASNEELQAMNEELRSATEELETSKEELQSVNEELAAVNLELKEKVDEISSSHSDLQNLMHSSDIGTVFLTRELKIKRYTRRVEQLLNIIETDIGRPFDHITYKFDYPGLAADAAAVIDTLRTIERQLKVPATGMAYLARLTPYRTLDDRIEGVVISFVDITELQRSGSPGK